MITLKLNSLKHEIAGSYGELKTRHFVSMLRDWEPKKDIADRDYFLLLNILSDKNFAFDDRTRSIDNELVISSALQWVVTEDFKFSTELPKVLKIGDKVIDVPKEPRELSIGQNIHLRRYLEKCKISEEGISMAIAIYLQPLIDNKLFHIEQAQHYAKKIDEMPIALTYPLGFFLLKRASKFGQKPEKTWPPLKINLKQILKNLWLKWRKSKPSTDSMTLR